MTWTNQRTLRALRAKTYLSHSQTASVRDKLSRCPNCLVCQRHVQGHRHLTPSAKSCQLLSRQKAFLFSTIISCHPIRGTNQASLSRKKIYWPLVNKLPSNPNKWQLFLSSGNKLHLQRYMTETGYKQNEKLLNRTKTMQHAMKQGGTSPVAV